MVKSTTGDLVGPGNPEFSPGTKNYVVQSDSEPGNLVIHFNMYL
jgi:hypothetical protein